ncbi:serine/threonine-protein kinase [Spirillospora sp. NPDC047279]|uniref:serine/threonine-protein kinase n=1 Tax=Spirillospora sp. NPDC047279 TaxID=3155478 RepID=UPI0033CF1FCC
MGSPRMPLEPLARQDPTRIGGYVLLGRLGTGAMGRVYLGRSAAGRLVAVKTIRNELADEGDFRTRFRHEIAAAGRVSGAFTAPVIDSDPDAEVPWLATSYVAAPSLDRLVRVCGPLPVAAVRWLAAGCAEALESIHRTDLLHRDLKPSNVLVSADGPRVIDFGVARAAERPTLTATHQAVGTPAYMAPEQARNARKTVQASDVFALGSTLLYAATGHPPYEGDSVTEILVRLATEPPDLSGLPAELTDVVTACLQREPGLRPTATALLARLGYGPGPELPSPDLPDCALALIEDYRHWPRRPAASNGERGEADEDSTFASPTSAPAVRPALAALQAQSADGQGGAGAGGEPKAEGGAGAEGRAGPAERFARPGDGSGVGSSADMASPATVGRRGGPAARRVLVTAGVVVLVVAAGLLGAVYGDRGDGQDGAQNGGQGTGQQAQQNRGGGPPPAPPVPWSGAGERLGGKPRIMLNQPQGDGHTVFVVHGRGWSPGAQITIRIDKLKPSPAKPVADVKGTFNYALNQNREFFAGKIPPGVHHILVTSADGATQARAKFTVNNL